jgi:hypothetical protein
MLLFATLAKVRQSDIRECGQLPINASDLSDARFREGSKFGTMFRAGSINPFEGGRWRLRWMRASGSTDLTAMGIESFSFATN